MKKLLKEDGQTLVLTTLCMGVLLGSLGMAIDVGMLLRSKRNMQIAADGAALAGATALYYNASVSTAVNAAAKANGVDPSVTGNVVMATSGQALGSTACASCVQVQLSKPAPTIFMQFLSQWISGNKFATVNVSAISIAGAPGTGKACGYIMSPSGDDALWIHGSGAIVAPGCGMYVNSNASDALCVTGSSSKSDFAWVDVVGQQGNGNCKGTISSSTTVYTSAPVQPAPFSNLADPASQCQTASNPTGTVAVVTPTSNTLTGTITGPGFGNVACYGGSGGAAITMNGATLGPGTYVFTTGVTISGTDTVGTSSTNGGATIAVSGGALTVNTTSVFNIHAPTSGTYNGLAVYQSSTDTSNMLLSFGSSGATFDGMVYAPGAQVELHDQGGTGTTTNFAFVVGTLYDNSNIDINFTNYTSAHPTTSPFRLITLVG